MANLGSKDWIVIKRLLRYLKYTQHYALPYPTTQFESASLQGWINPSSQLIGWFDSHWGGDMDDRKLTGGYGYTLVSVVISWKPKKQNTIALSDSTEAKYVAPTLVVKEGISIKSMLKEFSLFTISTMTLFCDNQCCIKLANNPKMSNNICHVDLKHHAFFVIALKR